MTSMPAAVSAASPVRVEAPRIDVRLLLALAAVYVVWGSTYYAMRIAVSGMPPMFMGAMRFTTAGAILLAVARLRGAPWPTRRQWLAAVPVGVLFFVGANGFVAIAEQSIGSGVAAVVCATMPLWTAVIASATGERSSAREWIGLALGFAGVVVLVGGAWSGGEPVHFVLLIVSPLAWAAGSVLARRMPLPAGVGAAGLEMTTGGLALGVVAALRGEPLPLHATAEAWLALIYLLIFGSLVAFTAFAWLLRNARSSVATSYAYVNPVVAVVLGSVIGGETLGPSSLLAAGLIVAAVALVITARRR